MTTSQQQAIKQVIPVLSFLLAVGWFPKKWRVAAKEAIGVLEAITEDMPEVQSLESPTKAQLLEQVRTAHAITGHNSFS